MGNMAITSRDTDFAKWYTDVIMAAKLADYSSVKGCVILEPNGYALWENIQKILDKKFKELGHENVYMPFLIPESLLNKEAELIEGFAPEGAWVTHGGNSELEERLMIRPTSETLFCDYYARKVKSYRDLPKLYNQWCNVMRWEKETRPFLRTREFLWQEGHTIHETREEAETETHQMINVYKEFLESILAIPVIVGKKTEKEKFAGAEYSLTVEALMYNGISLQSGTSHYFGQKFSRAYDIKFLNRENKLENPYQTSWGSTTRLIGALIMVHSDDNGLVLPPRIAPTQVVIVPIGKDDRVFEISRNIEESLKQKEITVFVDNSNKSPGFKFAEHETNGIPIRIEIGPRDLENNQITISRRDTLEKNIISLDNDIVDNVVLLLDSIQNNLYESAKKRMVEKTYECSNLKEVEEIMNTKPGFVKAHWCGDVNCEIRMKEIKGTKSRCIVDENCVDKKCIVCGNDAKNLVIWGIQY